MVYGPQQRSGGGGLAAAAAQAVAARPPTAVSERRRGAQPCDGRCNSHMRVARCGARGRRRSPPFVGRHRGEGESTPPL